MKNYNFVNCSLISEIEIISLSNILLSHILIVIIKAGKIYYNRTSRYFFSCKVSLSLWTMVIFAINETDSFLEHMYVLRELKWNLSLVIKLVTMKQAVSGDGQDWDYCLASSTGRVFGPTRYFPLVTYNWWLWCIVEVYIFVGSVTCRVRFKCKPLDSASESTVLLVCPACQSFDTGGPQALSGENARSDPKN